MKKILYAPYIKREITEKDGDLLCQRPVEFKQLEMPEDTAATLQGIRVWGGSGWSGLQLRAISPLVFGGKPRHLIATAEFLDKKELKALIERLQRLLENK